MGLRRSGKQTRAIRFIGLLAVTLLGSVAAGSAESQPAASQPSGSAEAELLARAARLWAARKAEDWSTQFEYRVPEDRAKIDPNEYIAWSKENDPFLIHEYKLNRAAIEGEMGWVEVTVTTSPRRYKGAPPNSLTRWEKWVIVEGDWYPVPPEFTKGYPAAPPLRNAQAEQALRGRVELAWAARKDARWKDLYELTDPRDREHVPQDKHQAAESEISWLDARIQWVEVIGEAGRSNCLITARPADPSMSKMKPVEKVGEERWVLVEGEWYLDLIAAAIQPASQGATQP